MKPLYRTVCVAVDLTACDTVNYNVLLSKTERSTLLETTCQTTLEADNQLQAADVSRIDHTGVPQDSQMSLTLFSCYIADMSRPTEAVKRI